MNAFFINFTCKITCDNFQTMLHAGSRTVSATPGNGGFLGFSQTNLLFSSTLRPQEAIWEESPSISKIPYNLVVVVVGVYTNHVFSRRTATSLAEWSHCRPSSSLVCGTSSLVCGTSSLVCGTSSLVLAADNEYYCFLFATTTDVSCWKAPLFMAGCLVALVSWEDVY